MLRFIVSAKDKAANSVEYVYRLIFNATDQFNQCFGNIRTFIVIQLVFEFI